MVKKKLLLLVSVLFLGVILVACGDGDSGAGAENELIGTWYWEPSPTFELTFNEDGTGTWTGGVALPSFEWSIVRGDLRMEGDAGRITWEFEVDGDSLRIDRSDGGPAESYTYTRLSD